MTGIKRAAPGGDEEKHPLDNVEVTEAEADKLQEIQESIARLELGIQLESAKRMRPIYEARRTVLKSINKFWPVAMMHTPAFAVHCQHAADIQALSYLEDFWVEYDPKEPRAFTLEFAFKENPYFSDKVLTKTHEWVPWTEADNTPDENGISKANIEFEYNRDIRIQATKINWKDPEQALTKLYPPQQDEEEGTSLADLGSFFNYFASESDPLEIGITLANEVFPEAIELFLNPQDDNIDSEEEDDEDDDDEEEDIDLEKPRAKKPKV